MRRRCSLMRRCLGISLPPLLCTSSANCACSFTQPPHYPTPDHPTTALLWDYPTTQLPRWDVQAQLAGGVTVPERPVRPLQPLSARLL